MLKKKKKEEGRTRQRKKRKTRAGKTRTEKERERGSQHPAMTLNWCDDDGAEVKMMGAVEWAC
jgi:hypothetical protein